MMRSVERLVAAKISDYVRKTGVPTRMPKEEENYWKWAVENGFAYSTEHPFSFCRFSGNYEASF